jgi:signal peptidase I
VDTRPVGGDRSITAAATAEAKAFPAGGRLRHRWSRRLALAAVVAAGGATAAILAPRRFMVEGTSMAPGLLPGDVVATDPLPLGDRLREPGRFDRWVLAADDGPPVIKRIAGLPGETVSLVAGDLVVVGRTILKGPRLLAEMGSKVAADGSPAAAGGADSSGWLWSLPGGEVLDDEPQMTATSVLLLPVRDVGCAAVVQVPRQPGASPLRVRARVADTVFTWRLRKAGRYAVVAGRLDGHLVAAAWRLPREIAARPVPRSCLPPAAPEAWTAVRPWGDSAAADTAPAVAVGLEPAAAVALAGATMEHAWRWRDVHHRAAADGTASWQCPPDTVFVLGDCPAASRDSRHWGPLPRSVLRQRIH